MSLRWSLRAAAPRILAGDPMPLVLEVENLGDRDVSFPHPGIAAASSEPRFQLERPDGSVDRFSPRERSRDVEGDPPSLLATCASRSRWECGLGLESVADLSAPGRYEVRIEIPVDGRTEVAGPAVFHVEAQAFRSPAAHVAWDGASVLAGEVAVHHGAGAARAVHCRVGEDAAERFRPRLDGFVDVAPLPAETRRLHGVAASHALTFQPYRWVVASLADRLHVATGPAGASAEVPSAGVAVLGPVLSLPDALWIVGTRGQASELVVARVARAADGTLHAQPWTTVGTWPRPFSAATVALATHEVPRIAVAAASVHGDASLVEVRSYDPGGQSPTGRLLGTFRLDGRCPAGGIGAWEGCDGSLHVTAVVERLTDDGTTVCDLADLTVDAQGERGVASAPERVASLAAGPWDALVAVFPRRDRMDRCVVVRDARGGGASCAAGRAARPLEGAWPPGAEAALLPTVHGWALFVVEGGTARVVSLGR